MNTTVDHIAIVDDDPDIRRFLSLFLKSRGFRVSVCRDAKDFWELFKKVQVDLVLLDLNLPDQDGLEICRNIRARSSIAVIILTGRAEEVERIVGLEMGADDYLVKPVPPRELLARVKNVLSRARQKSNAGDNQNFERMRFSGWVLESASRRLTSPSGREVILTDGEFRMLQIFLQNANQVLSRDELLDLTRGREAEPFDRSVDIQVSRLRRRLQDDPQKARIIQTVRGEGYKFISKVVKDVQRPLEEEEGFPADESPGAGRKVLVVDDDEVVRMTLESFLNSLGCRVVQCGSGREAVEMFKAGRLDLILMDCYLPGLDGYAACEEIRTLEEESGADYSTPVIAVSYSSPSDERGRWIGAGMNDFLEKPVRLGQLKGVLERWLPISGEPDPEVADLPLDYTLIKELRLEVGDQFPKVVERFLETLPLRIEALRKADEAEDYQGLLSEVERIWGSGLSMGAQRLTSYCRDLTALIRAGGRDCSLLISELEAEEKRISAVLREELGKK